MIESAYSIEIINNLLKEAYQQRASDIHLEPYADGLGIRLRIDGILYTKGFVDYEYRARIISRIKVLASMNVAEKRIPQDGKFTYTSCSGALIDLRIATFPTLYGEKVVIRLLDQSTHALELGQLGFTLKIIEMLQFLVNKTNGFLVVVGPTGSGKTTTLYSLLSLIQSQEKNIMTLEDPIEYTLKGIIQSQIYPEVDFTFARGIRSLLRQDPDIIMVGEIRDQETARISLQAALTGHLVLSTLHTKSAASTVMRLLDMSIEPYLLNASLTGILAQRLMRSLCKACRYEDTLSEYDCHIIKRFNIGSIKKSFKSLGCIECNNTGFKGRVVLAELLTLTHSLRALITKAPLFNDIYQRACQDGMIPLLYDAADKVNRGVISFKDLLLVLDY